MKNIEKYEEEIKELNYDFALINNKLRNCKEVGCSDCQFNYGSLGCKRSVIEWLFKEYKEPILTEKEKAYLKNVIEPRRNDVTIVTKSLVGKPNEYFTVNVYNKNSYNNGYEGRLLEFIVTEDMPFNGMEQFKHYTLEELGL